jgi:hypothetical protein
VQKSDLGKVNSPPLLQTQGMMPGAATVRQASGIVRHQAWKTHAKHRQSPTHDQFMTHPCILRAEHWLVELPYDVTKRQYEAITVAGQNAWPNRKKTFLTAQEPKPLPHWKCRTVLQPHHLQAGSCKERLFTCRKSWWSDMMQ